MISDVNSLLSIIVTRLLTYYLAIIYPLQYQNIITGNSVGSAQDNNPPTLVNCQQPEGNTTIIFVLSVWNMHNAHLYTSHAEIDGLKYTWRKRIIVKHNTIWET